MDELFKRGRPKEEGDEKFVEADRVKGVGTTLRPSAESMRAAAPSRDVLPGVEISHGRGGLDNGPRPVEDGDGSHESDSSSGRRRSKKARKEDKKDKKDKKERKQMKKEVSVTLPKNP